MIVGDGILGEDPSEPEYNHPKLIEFPLHLALPCIFLLLLSLAWAGGTGIQDFLNIGELLAKYFQYDFIASRNSSIWSDYLAGTIGVGFMVAGYGTNVGHELTHRIKNKLAMLEGRWLLSASCNPDFAIEHVFGHHVTVCTEDDPATAKRGENVYAFFFRSTILGHLSAWSHEIIRLNKKDNAIFSLNNRMLTGYLMSAVWPIMFYSAAGVFGLLLFFSQAVFAKLILEIVNYMEHYGLTRKPGQQVGPEHSWNTNQTMSGMVLFSLTRHSAHHEKPKEKFWKLESYENAPQMPYGYLITLVICLIPPLWYRIINPRLDQWELEYS